MHTIITMVFLPPEANGIVEVKGDTFNLTLEDILHFCTGMPEEPPLGFRPKPAMKFTMAEASKFPEANTCVNILYLPLAHTTYDEFAWHMCYGICNSPGFGKV